MTSPRIEQTEFAPAPIRRRRRGDAVAGALVAVVVVGLAVAIAKPWQGGGAPPASAGPPATTGPATAEPSSRSEASGSPGRALTWAQIGPALSRHDTWGVRAVTADRGYHELWQPSAGATRGGWAPIVIAPGAAPVVALGITFPPGETPLDIRAWLDHGASGLEWIDARPVNQLPGLGAYLLLRPGDGGQTLPWAPGRYRIDVLVGHAIRRLEIEIRDATGAAASVPAWNESALGWGPIPAADVTGIGLGAFAWDGTTATAIPAIAGAALDEVDAWLDVDLGDAADSPRSSVGRLRIADAAALGVALPPSSVVHAASIRALAPEGAMPDDPPETVVSTGANAFVAFNRSSGAAWRPGVYALRVSWLDGSGSHDRTWHVELLPGPARPEPWLLAATRAWGHLAGASGILLGVTSDATQGAPVTQVQLLPVSPQNGATYPGLSGLRTLGCGETLVRGHPTVIGFVGPAAATLTPIGAAIQYPFYAVGSMSILTASGSVPGLALATPRLTGPFEGPAAYGFRVGPGPTAPTYTVCIDMQPVG